MVLPFSKTGHETSSGRHSAPRERVLVRKYGKRSVFYALCALYKAVEFFRFFFLAFDYNNLKTVVMVKMYMLRRQDNFLKIVLYPRKFLKKFSFVMVVNYVYGTYYAGVVSRERIVGYVMGYKVFDGF
jgi:hypothetical protein